MTLTWITHIPLGQTDRSQGTRLFVSVNTKSRLTDRSLGMRFFMNIGTQGRLTSPMGQGSLWALTLGVGLMGPLGWDSLWAGHLGQTDWFLGTRFSVSCDTWGRLMGPLGWGSSWALTLGADWQVPWDEDLQELQHSWQLDQFMEVSLVSIFFQFKFIILFIIMIMFLREVGAEDSLV